MVSRLCALLAATLATVALTTQAPPKAGDTSLGTQKYDAYERPAACATCHIDIARQHEQAMMSQAYTHHCDEIEYFELAVPHAEKEPKVAGVEAGCNGCHAPIAFLAGSGSKIRVRSRCGRPTMSAIRRSGICSRATCA
jgi:hypothetical protein